MAYTPTTVTADNFEFAIQKNLEDIYEEIGRKIRIDKSNQLIGDLDMNANQIKGNRDAQSAHEPITKRQMEA